MALLKGKLFSGALFAGALLSSGATTEAPEITVPFYGFGGRSFQQPIEAFLLTKRIGGSVDVEVAVDAKVRKKPLTLKAKQTQTAIPPPVTAQIDAQADLVVSVEGSHYEFALAGVEAEIGSTASVGGSATAIAISRVSGLVASEIATGEQISAVDLKAELVAKQQRQLFMLVQLGAL